jgi:UDP-glucose:(glucosyl)LPS alpha-1,2-glucosyltransferase
MLVSGNAGLGLREPAWELQEGRARPSVALVLPPREGFSPGGTGAIGLLVHAEAAGGGRFAAIVLGQKQAAPFDDVAYCPVQPSWWPGSFARRYAGGVAFCLRRQLPAIIEVHNRLDVALFLARRFPATPVWAFLNNDPQGMRGGATPRERTAALARLARIGTSSAWLRARLLEGVAAPARAPVVLPNWLDLRRVPQAQAERDKVILFAGRVVADKGADTFVRACAQALPDLPGWRAEMIGADRFSADSADTGFIRALRPQAEAAGIAMLGYRPHAAVLAAMARAAIVVVPSRWPEPFGLTALEAMACGAALLVSPRGGLPEFTAGAALPIDPDDPASLAEALRAVAGDPARRATLSEAGLARARDYDVGAGVARLDALREEVLATWSPGAQAPI